MIIQHKDTSTSRYGEGCYKQILSIKFEDRRLFQWLMNLDRKTIQKAFIYAGRTELSYLQLSWNDYQHDQLEFINQWSSVLLDYYQQLQKHHSC